MRTIVFVVFAAGMAAAGCGRAHISPAFGKANQEAISMQQPPLPTAAPSPNMSLDTQEADVISNTYLKGLAGKSKVEDPEPVLYVAPAQRQQRPPPLPPSVPKD